MALAAAFHHSAGPSKKKVVERREEQEKEVYETHVALRGPKTPPGTRLGLLTEPAPQVRGEAIDSGALSFLLQQQLTPRDEEEEEEPQVDKLVPESVEWVQLLDRQDLLLEQACSCDLCRRGGLVLAGGEGLLLLAQENACQSV